MISQESAQTAKPWSLHGKDYLDSYLIQEVEHPALNPQSILIRAFTIDRICPNQFSRLVEEELYFSACACFALLGHREGWFRELYCKIIDPSQDAQLPGFLQQSYRETHAPKFEVRALFDDLARCLTLGFEFFESPFAKAWAKNLGDSGGPVENDHYLELACGSANDYRFFDQYGLAASIEYVGVDLCPENVANSKARFPDVEFIEDDASSLDRKDDEFDVVWAFDLFEHLSPSGLEDALSEAVRVCRDEVWLSFFNLAEVLEHEFSQQHANYYWNKLSLTRVAESLRKCGCSKVDVVSVPRELEGRFPGYRHYNPDAQIVIGSVH